MSFVASDLYNEEPIAFESQIEGMCVVSDGPSDLLLFRSKLADGHR